MSRDIDVLLYELRATDARHRLAPLTGESCLVEIFALATGYCQSTMYVGIEIKQMSEHRAAVSAARCSMQQPPA